ncbi:MAG TPA: type IV pilus twitching motility protein PilT [Patescibacteria group bacterium]|nr:type IV pilus twitching motility protein PilT [Patescibacteria group bacterium]
MGVSLDNLLSRAIEAGASDLHLKVGRPPGLRINGHLSPLEGLEPLTAEDTAAMAAGMMTPEQKSKLDGHAEVDLAYEARGLARFRVNVFRQRGQLGMVLRVISDRIPGFEALMLPAVLEKISEERRGLVLVTGTTGSGKSTTLAAIVDRINSTRPEHIITIEDPIEYLHHDKQSFVNQREVSVDTGTFASALRAALRQDPDVILVGEMRDLETISTALLAAETGHLVLSTLHTLDAAETIQRIIAVFPPNEQKQIRHQLASTLKAVVSQRLMRRSDGKGRVPAVEVLVTTAYIRDCITNPDKTSLVHDAIAAGTSQYGMQTFDQSIYDLLQKGLITYDEALAGATNPGEFKLRVEGISSSGDISREESGSGSAAGPKVERFGSL